MPSLNITYTDSTKNKKIDLGEFNKDIQELSEKLTKAQEQLTGIDTKGNTDILENLKKELKEIGDKYNEVVKDVTLGDQTARKYLKYKNKYLRLKTLV